MQFPRMLASGRMHDPSTYNRGVDRVITNLLIVLPLKYRRLGHIANLFPIKSSVQKRA